MAHVLLHSLLDSLKAFVVVFIIYIIISFFEMKIANKLSKENKISPLYGSLFGLIPQCGMSVVAADLYLKRHISVGTLMAVFIACSDEAIPIIVSSGNSKAWSVIPLIIVKLFIGFIIGFIFDLIISKKEINEHLDSCDHHDIEVHTGCCNHHIDDEEEDFFDKHIWHPFIHSLRLLTYIFIINLSFSLLVYFIGEANIALFLENNKYFSPLYATLIGLIPNCASSVVLAELFINGGISFGATLAGLCVNAGLGMVFIFKSKERIKDNMMILISLLLISLFIGYLTCLVIGF